MNIDPSHPAMKWKANLDAHAKRDNDIDIPLQGLFRYFNKNFADDHATRALWSSRLKELGYTNKEVSEAVDIIVVRMDKFPTLADVISFLPDKHKNNSFYSSYTKEKEYEDKIIKQLNEQFKATICDGDEEKYKETMTKCVSAWLLKVVGLTKNDLAFYGFNYKLWYRCFLVDWRDAGFDIKKTIEVGIEKQTKYKSQIR